MTDFPFTVEYAKSSRAGCKACQMNIEKDELRLGIMVQSPHFDGRIPMWHHYKCFWRKTRVYDVQDLHGFDRLRWDDQEKLRAEIASGKNSKPPYDSPSLNGSVSFNVEYSKGSTSKCRLCDEKIQKGSIRIGMNKKFFHFDCAIKRKDEIGFHVAADEISGFQTLSDEDKIMCKEMTKPEKRPIEQDAVNGSDAKRQKVENGNTDSLRDQLKKQSDDLWAIRDALEKNLTNKQMSALLTANDQEVPVQSSISDRLSDCMLFGAPLRCSECGKGQLVFSSSNQAYICTGSISAFTRCQFRTQDPIRKHFDLPPEYGDLCPFLANYKFVFGRKRIFHAESRRSIDSAGGHLAKIGYRKSTADFVSSAPSTTKLILKDGAAVDPQSDLAAMSHVYRDKEGNKYSVILNAVDAQSGRNSYYKLQLIAHDTKKKYCVFRAWGRIGTSIGNTKVEKFGADLNAALADFKALYLEKTGNNWEERHNFVKHPGYFMPIEIDYSDQEEQINRASMVAPKSKSLLQIPVQNFIEAIFDVKKMADTLKEFEVDLKKMPLGKLSKNQIKSAYLVLSRLQEVLSSPGTPNRTQILDCTNQFYSLVPHDFGMQTPHLIDSLDVLKTKNQMLESLLEIELAYNILKSESKDDERDPVDIHYEKLKANLKALEKESSEFKMITEYATNTQGSTHILYKLHVDEILMVERQGESEKYDQKCGAYSNKMMLWHGSRTSNYAGIVSQGLRIAPPEAPVTGYMFGKGIYFSDMFSKSANYCCPTAKNDCGYLLLCEVALGEMHELTTSNCDLPKKLPKNKQSVKGCGKTAPDPASNFTLANGVVVPMGKAKPTPFQNSSLLYNEYIVYDVAQVKLKYIVKLNFRSNV